MQSALAEDRSTVSGRDGVLSRGDLPQEPAAVRSAIELCRISPLPMMVWWSGDTEPFVNAACAAYSATAPNKVATSLRRALETDIHEVMRTGQALYREAVAQMLPPSDMQEGPCGSYCLHPLQDRGRTVGVLLIGTHADPRPTATWRERMNYASVIHSMDLGYCRVELLDATGGQIPDYRFLEVNQAYETHTGLRNMVGRRISEVVEHREPFWAHAFDQVLSSGEMLKTTVTMSSTQHSYETCIMRMGGPGSRQVAVLLKDVGAQIAADLRLKESEKQAREAACSAERERAQMAAMIEATPAAVVVFDQHHAIRLCNSYSHQVWGNLSYNVPTRWEAHWADGSERHGQPVPHNQRPSSRALRGESCSEVIEVVSPADATTRRIFLVSAAPIWNQQWCIEGAAVVAVDITDRVRAERALQQANLRKDEFLAMLAHELRNPLAPLAAAAELMGHPGTSVAALQDASAVVIRQVRHMQGLIDDLLDTSRLERGRIELTCCPCDLRLLIAQAVEQVRPLIEASEHELHIELPQQPLPVQADAKRMVQILANLLNNAAKYTPNGGQIRLKAQCNFERAQIEVEDNGIGMDTQTMEHAFELFAQAKRSADRQQGGLGIGLALVKKLVHLHGGQVQAKSAGPGCGSVFSVLLPLCPIEQVDLSPPQAASAPAQALEGLRILLVDDNVDAAQTLAMLLRAFGHECHVAHEGEQALQLAGEIRPQVFILDIGLPGMDGHQLARRLRQAPKSAGARIVALSGYAQPTEQEAALSAGFDQYLVKPVDAQKLLAAIEGRVQQPALS